MKITMNMDLWTYTEFKSVITSAIITRYSLYDYIDFSIFPTTKEVDGVMTKSIDMNIMFRYSGDDVTPKICCNITITLTETGYILRKVQLFANNEQNEERAQSIYEIIEKKLKKLEAQ